MLARKLGLNFGQFKIHMAMYEKERTEEIFCMLKRKRIATEKSPAEKRRKEECEGNV